MSPLRVTVLGCSGSYAAPGTACTGYLVQSEGINVLLDCGPGVLANLQRHIDVADIDAVVNTHCHADHWVELPVLRTIWTYFLGRKGLPVFGTAETREMNRIVCGGEEPEAFAWTDVHAGDSITIGGQKWRFSLADHPVETLAVRVDCGDRSFVFSSDTGTGWQPGAFLQDVDLALLEASYTAEREPEGFPHLSARQAGVMAREHGVGRLVLTHQMPGADVAAHHTEGSEAFGRSVLVAYEHAIYEV